MIDKKTRADEAARLRQQAEPQFDNQSTRLDPLIVVDSQQLVHELQVHQIELELQIEELRQSQVELAVQRDRYFDLYDLAPVGYLTLSEKGLILGANLTAAGLLGVDCSKLVSQRLSHFIHKDDQDIYYIHRKSLLETREPHNYELRMLKHDSRPASVRGNGKDLQRAAGKGETTIWVHLTISLVQKPLASSEGPNARGDITVFRVMLSEITERKRVEQQLVESRTNFRSLIETIDDIIVVATPEGNILFGNAALKHKLGYAPEDLSGMHLLDLNPADKRQEAEAIFAAMFRGERTTCPLPLVAKNKTLVPAETRAWIGKWNGLDCLFGVSKDLSVERESQQRFEQLFRHNPALMAVSSNPEYRFTDVNDVFLATLGYTPEEILGKTSAEIGLFLKPQQQATSIEQLQSNGRISGIELQVRCKDGSVLDGLFSGDTITSHGKDHFLTVMVDITERKLKEEEVSRLNAELELRVLDRTTDLATSNRLLEEKVAQVLADQKSLQQARDKLEQIFALLPVGISILDHEHRLIKMNPALKTILGITSEGLSARQFKKRRYFRPDGTLMPFEELASTRVYNGETQALDVETGVEKEDGSIVWTNVSAVAGLFDDWGAVIVATDITQRRKAEDEIRNHTVRAETLVRTGAILSSDLDLKITMQTVCLEAARVLKAPAANIFLSDARNVELTLAGSFGLPVDFSQRCQSFPKVLIEQIAARQGIDRIGVLSIAQFLDQPNIKLFSAMGMQSVMCVKMMHNHKLVGLLSVFSPNEVAHFSAADQGLLLGLADQVAQAVVNIRLFEQVNAGQQHLRNLSAALIDMEENERRNLALELHDQLGQMLSTVKMSLDMIPALPRADADEQLQRAGQFVSDMIARVRRIALDLRPSILDDRGLLPALLYLFKSFQTQNGEAVAFKHSGLGLRLPPRVEITAYRIIQEALTNIQRHAGKTDVYIDVWANDHCLNLQIRDLGVGFDPTVFLKGISSGLSGIRERVRLLGGDLVIESAPGKGATVTAMLPVLLIQENA
jgi:PAS domain S-box-containing protein